MARLSILVPFALAGCGNVVGLGGSPTPLARIQVEVSGDPIPPAAHLRVALVWGAQWLPEPFCVLPPESAAAAAVIQAGCRDSFGFVPKRVAANIALAPGTPVTLELFDLPAADVMVGDVTARVAYGSLVVYDDRNDNGTLELRQGERVPPGSGPDAGIDLGDAGPVGPADVVCGASFLSMTRPDQRIAFREGDFNAAAAFYPRQGCPPPPRGFSVLAAGGFSEAAALAAILAGQLPPEDPQTCAEVGLDQSVVSIAISDPAAATQVACLPRGTNGIPRYRDPPAEAPDLTNRTWACAGLPDLGSPGQPSPGGVTQLVVSGPPTNACKSLTHYVLRGCDNDPNCASPEWDFTATPPSWWPCSH
jgi:hypothetical protein